MLYSVTVLGTIFLFGVIYVAMSPTPVYAAWMLVVACGVGCAVVGASGSFFLALLLFLTYLGGMMVVFAFCVGMSVDLPKRRGGVDALPVRQLMVLGLIVVCALVSELSWQAEFKSIGEFMEGFESGLGGVCELYNFGGCYLFIAGWILMLTLFVVLELVRGVSFGAVSDVS